MSELPNTLRERLKRDADGLFCAVVQDNASGRVLMVAYMNDEALKRTLESGLMTYWSRSRQEYWRKGETSGHYQLLKRVEIDCDGDALLFTVQQLGAACHNGTNSCFDTDFKIDFSMLSQTDLSALVRKSENR